MRNFVAAKIPSPPTDFRFAALTESPAIDLEIGAGQGLHAIAYCKANPARTLIAVEKTLNRFQALAGRHASHPQLSNLHVVRADAVAFVTHCLPDESLQRIFLLYPNPYPKPKQANRRWHNRPFFAELLRKLKVDGELILATNLEWYASEVQTRVAADWAALRLTHCQTVVPSLPARTHFEKKYLSRGEICWDLRFRKTQAALESCPIRGGKVQ